MNIDYYTVEQVKESLTKGELNAIECLSISCFEEGVGPLLRGQNYWGKSQDCYDGLVASLNLRNLSSFPDYEFQTKPEGLAVELIKIEMQNCHLSLFLDADNYIQRIREKSAQIADLVCKKKGDAGLVNGYDAVEICNNESLRCELDQAIPGYTNASSQLQEVLWSHLKVKSKICVRVIHLD